MSSRPYLIYTGIETWLASAVAVASTTAVVYRVESGHLNALELILVGTAVELVYFVFQLPTGILADLVSRRLCVVAGVFLTAAGFLGQWASASFAVFVLAQVPIGVGAALMVGAQEAWLADESGSSELTSAFLRAGQWSLGGTLVGSVLGGLLARAGLSLPYLVGGVVTGLLGVVLVMVMPENSFRPSAWHRGELRGVLRQARGTFTGQVKATRTAMVAVSGLVALLVMTFFLGMWGESFDRLWGAYLLEDIRFPHLLGLTAVTWFSVLAVCASLLCLLSTQVAKRRTDRLGPSSVAGTLLACTLVTAAAVVALGAARTFPVVIVAYLVVTMVRPLFWPLMSGWTVARIGPEVRATALSAVDLADSGGQILGGPVIGVIGTIVSIRVALLAGAAALAPAAAAAAVATVAAAANPVSPVDPTGTKDTTGDADPTGSIT